MGSESDADTMDARVEALARYLAIEANHAGGDAAGVKKSIADAGWHQYVDEAAKYVAASDAVAQAPQQPMAGRYGWNHDMDAMPWAITLLFLEAMDADGIEVARLGLRSEAGAAVAWAYLPGVVDNASPPREQDVQRLSAARKSELVKGLCVLHERLLLAHQQRDFIDTAGLDGEITLILDAATALDRSDRAIAAARREALEQAIDRVDSAYPPDTIETSHQVQIFSDMKAFFVSRIRALIQSQPLQEER